MLDVGNLVQLIQGMLLRPQPTWQAYLAEGKRWQQTLQELTLPLMVGSLILSLVISFLFPNDGPAMTDLGLGGLVVGLFFGVASFFVAGFFLALLAGAFKGRNDFDSAFSALTLTSVPSCVGTVIEPLPLIGTLLYILSAIYSMVLLYRIIPDALGVPGETRVIHFIAWIIAGSVAIILISMLVFPVLEPFLPTE